MRRDSLLPPDGQQPGPPAIIIRHVAISYSGGPQRITHSARLELKYVLWVDKPDILSMFWKPESRLMLETGIKYGTGPAGDMIDG